MNKVFLHVDLDAFFASVEQLDHPEYRGKPVIVGGLPGDRRSVVSTASYEARKFGVHSAMPTFQAVKLCPHGIFLRGRMHRYHEKSEEVMAIFRNYSPDIQQISVDEAFIDLTGTERLFGNPIDTAKKLKAEVLEKTGLTVSVGLASTKYCAKIASGLQKPDGLTVVPFGKESDFMLSLPLTKVWGAGKKTLAKLENYGIKTTRDIYTRSEKLLQSLFGNAAGSFLYNAVRGNEGVDFHAEPKSRSISAENTYEYDLTDRDAIETALLHLCYTVMFRSLREKVRSSSVSLKIRYEDFTTVSVQETSERYISSVDDLFERAKKLLEKKRDTRLGIRLLGLAMQNLEDEDVPRQQELFDFGEDKKRKVESAILKAQEKDPRLKITKARLLGSSLLALAMIFSPLQGAKAESEKEADGAAGIVFDTSKLPLSNSGKFVSLFNKDFGEQNVEFFAEGFWKSTVTGGGAYSFGFGSTPTLSTTTPVFAQNVDLSLYFMLNHHWYFEAAFADEFTKNTVAAGYIGDGYLKSARISNRKIIFPSLYSVDAVNRGIGGGDNQAPGLSFNWKGEKWRADAAVRYDFIEAHEKTWYGKNAVSINEISLSNYNSGNQYILPKSSMVQSVKAVYVESSSGNYRDSKGRKYKKLDESQYLLMASQNQILLSKDAKAYRQGGVLPAVAVTFYSSVSESDFTDYLSKIKDWFSQSENSNFKIENYFYSIINSIDGENSLFLQHPSGFSPFAVASRYDCGSSSASDAQVAYSSTGSADTTYTAVIDEDNLRFASTDFFYSNHLYADLSRSEDDESSDEVERLIHAAFPLAKEHPKIYLLTGQKEDLTLQVRTFTPVNRLDIGTKAVSGTITVYKNGIIDPTASYDEESGSITLSSAVSASDHITARWYEESEDSTSGALASAGGFKYDFTEKLSADISASSRWSYSPDREFADSSYASKGFATAASSISYKGEKFYAKNTVAATYENTNTTGNYLILGNNDSSSESYYLSKKAGVNLPGGFAPTINEKETGGISNTELKSTKNGSVEVSEGKSDSEISGYALPFEWDFSSLTAGSGENQIWAAQSIYTPGVASSLANASTFSIALKNASYSQTFDTTNCSLYLQLGVSADDDFSVEESDKIPTWKISDSASGQIKNSFDFSKSGWQIVKISLSDEDRAVISSLGMANARLIITSKDTAAIPQTGTIFAGPYEAGGLTFTFSSEADVTSTNYQTKDTELSSSKIKKFNKSQTNTVQFFEWTFGSSPSEDKELIFTRTFPQVDLSEYKKLSFFIKAENASSVTVTLSRPKSSSEEKAIIYKIENPSNEWKEYTIDLSGSTDSSLTILDTDIVPTKLTITLEAKSDGKLSFDELYLSENTPFIVLQDKMEAGYKIKGSILASENHEILKDFSISATADGASSIESEHGKTKEKSLQGTGNLAFTLTNIKISAGASLSNAYDKSKKTKSSDLTQKNTLAAANHSLETEKPLLKMLSFSEKYNYSANDGSLEKANFAKIDFSEYFLPISMEGITKASSDSWSLSQNSETKAAFKGKNFSLSASAKASQKILTDSALSSSSKGKEKFATENYASAWKEITEFTFDTGDEKASKRSVGLSSSASYAFEHAKVKPAIFFETEGNYKSASKNTFTDSSKAGFEIPFAISKNNFAFSWKKSAGSSAEIEKGGDYQHDTEELSKALNEKNYFLKAAPIYDLASAHLAKEVYETERESNFYTGAYAFTWKRAFFANKYDFFIPQSAKVEATRDIRTGSSTADFYQIKNTVNYTALNIFGRSGNLPIFSFFSNDEYASSLTAAVKIPRENSSNYSYLVSGYVQATLYFTSQNYLKNGFEGSIEGKTDWKTKYTLIWKRNASSSLAQGIAGIFKGEAAENTSKITKTDSLNLSASCASPSSSTGKPVRKYTIAYSHATETQVSKYVSLNTDVGLSYYALWEKIATLTATATLGATIKF
ncbi:DNA polymerase IV [uncultured Treponema sp.]|uniref:DNA polymerase IV n=1 Tax=uncultured Treponema sp. TaxID=162155 RepID=UPI003458EFDE